MLMHDEFGLLCKSGTILLTDRIVLSCLGIRDYCQIKIGLLNPVMILAA